MQPPSATESTPTTAATGAPRPGADEFSRRLAGLVPDLRRFIGNRVQGRDRLEFEPSDLVQSALRQALLHRNQFAADDPARLRSWVYRIAIRKLLNRRRDRRRQRRDPSRLSGDPALLESVPQGNRDDVLAQVETMDRLTRALDAMPPELREVFTLRHVEGLLPETIASRLDESEATVRKRLTSALADFSLRLS